ncbi:TPA: phage antirepressor KilAC domain-containing protein [Clostridium botulinum]|nr:phage antirepressor KilAC domain-containing protein [Clostridium botulinum]
MKSEELMERKDLREKLIENVEALNKVKNVILLPYGECMTMQMVADYFEVGEKAINSLMLRNKDELLTNGLKILKGKELKDFKGKLHDEVTLEKLKFASQLAIFIRRTILNVAMLLTESDVAKEIRTRLLDMTENKETIKNAINEIDEEKQLMLNIMMAKDDMEQAMAVNKLKQYKDDREKKIKEERDMAVKKVVNLTDSDATFGLREAKNNLGVKENLFKNWLIHNKYMYRQMKTSDKKNNPTGRLKAFSKYTQGDTRYFTDIKIVDRVGREFSQTVFTIDGIEFFRTKIDKINKFNK